MSTVHNTTNDMDTCTDKSNKKCCVVGYKYKGQHNSLNILPDKNLNCVLNFIYILSITMDIIRRFCVQTLQQLKQHVWFHKK